MGARTYPQTRASPRPYATYIEAARPLNLAPGYYLGRGGGRRIQRENCQNELAACPGPRRVLILRAESVSGPEQPADRD